jgi:hypothetical protein
LFPNASSHAIELSAGTFKTATYVKGDPVARTANFSIA